jgi:HD-GYP domain-containing protein (c-di-GMP phosphodiesterase class II)
MAHCEVAMGLARRLPLPESDRRLLAFAFERWNGAGPQRLRRSAIPFVAAAVVFAHDAATLAEYLGPEAVLPTLRGRAGRTTDPELVASLEAHAAELLPLLSTPDAWAAVLDLEPRPVSLLDEAQLEDALVAVAEFADMKNLLAPLHSQRVARYAEHAARVCGLGGDETRRLRHAALVHDLGRTAVTAAIWDRRGPIDADEWAQVRLYPFHTDRVVRHSAALSATAGIATMVAERLDGSGYHRGLKGAAIPPSARILAVADVFAALTEPRPHRPAMEPGRSAELLLAEARSGRLDAGATAAVIGASGERAPSRRQVLPAGLSEREAEVLAAIAQGLSNRQVADRFHISPKTVGNHVEHVYDKIGVSTRAAAALFAVQHGLVAGNEGNTP